jgi:hypothetical protein
MALSGVWIFWRMAMRYKWEVVTVALVNLEGKLNEASAKKWEVFSVLAVNESFVIIVRRPF